MAKKENKVPENVSGKFYVDDQCIDCDLCRDTAPDFFDRSQEGGYMYVQKQPSTEAEMEEMAEVVDICPVDAIGDDGG